MNPSDTHIERMAEIFAARTTLRPTLRETKAVWRDALEIARETGELECIERNLRERRLADPLVDDAWDRARRY